MHIHRHAGAARLTRCIGARAFTYGLHVVFGSRRYAPGTASSAALRVQATSPIRAAWSGRPTAAPPM